jgi:hypothetical protein
VGRGEQAGAHAGGAQDPLDQRGGRALAVRAGEVDGQEAAVRPAESVEQRARAGEAEARLAALEAVQAFERRAVRVAGDQGR